MALHAAMCRYGNPFLLWITEADADHLAGSVQLVAPGLLWGRMERFAPYTNAHDTNFTGWVDVCQGAYLMWQHQTTIGTVLQAPIRHNRAANLLATIPREDMRDDLPRIILQSHNINNTAILGPFPYRSHATQTLCRTTLTGDGIAMIGVRVSGLVSGQPYTFSLWFKPEPKARFEQAWVLCETARNIRRLAFERTLHATWQRLEVTAEAPSSGIIFPRINVKGKEGCAVYTANWRLEPGPLVDSFEYPGISFPAMTEE